MRHRLKAAPIDVHHCYVVAGDGVLISRVTWSICKERLLKVGACSDAPISFTTGKASPRVIGLWSHRQDSDFYQHALRLKSKLADMTCSTARGFFYSRSTTKSKSSFPVVSR